MLNLKGYTVQRIEQQGVPDVVAQKKGHTLWLELKVLKTVKDMAKPKWRPGQLAWARRWAQFGGDVKLALWVDGGTHKGLYILAPAPYYAAHELKSIQDWSR